MGYLDRQPTTDTIAYFKFENDKSDSVSGGPTLSNSNASITTLDGVKCLYIPGTTQYINYGFRVSDVKAGIIRVKGNFRGSLINQRRYINSSSDHHRQIYINSNGTLLYGRYQQGGADINYSSALNSNWHCIGFTEDSSGAKLFLDGNSTPVGTNGTQREFSTLTQNTGLGARVNNGSLDDAGTGYIGRVVLFSNGITINDFLDFYNKTKKKYGIS